MSAAQYDKSMPKDGPVQPSQADQLVFYGLYKQITVGDVNTSRPGMLDFTGKAKWDAWKINEGKDAEECKAKYVQALIDILEKNKDHDEAVEWLNQLNA
ncbi:acyl-CoA-binding protein (ACBP)/diazepam binding inhibitor (DBI)/endozepine (EP) [Tilletia horrida]|uniref:Acyl-CoA-binding protein (ACBP)/diazepam binding inhibitor (DBI)/endozepine (EP) n=1 Tax=Tilletia horrida TaxID=155126 RepID=A0AAN6GYF3_9BASI|nr:acyl-CoA-binding protein (ACBP)/diazepam binding inhibitor (DBI)/endozepine (EP) [Tilletia horrida]KAK0555501.1 acyl-CoA-binding protein (ACBP)/diazepam binding inhibitor (DBI)/endozepine (EP) [Tilletia horrida]KAK0563047.1 acyl-CoA-binding protein (ACBP)/diazepam binding inhibitor (DBI)/endozepine (EP) [Tilletia horrida]